jgi:hypothetical protein
MEFENLNPKPKQKKNSIEKTKLRIAIEGVA